MDSLTREKNFIKDWEALLEKHGATVDVDYTYRDGVNITVSMYSVYNNKTDELEKEFCEFKLYF